MATEAVKHDGGKPNFDLLPPESLAQVQAVLEFGARKYAPHNWRKGMGWRRLLGACFRHLFAWACGEDKDPESGQSHLAHAACCILFLLSYEVTGAGTDDRFKRTEDAS
jgi:hypothetical protein